MPDLFLAVWPDGASRWQLVCRSADLDVVEAGRRDWKRALPRGAHGYWLSGECPSSWSAEQLDELLGGMPSMPSLMEMRDDAIELEGRPEADASFPPLPLRW